MTAIGERRHPARMGSRLDVKALVVFFALAYALSWSWAFPLVAAHLVVLGGAGWPTHYPALFGPAIAAVAVTAWTLGREGVRDLLARGSVAGSPSLVAGGREPARVLGARADRDGCGRESPAQDMPCRNCSAGSAH